MRVVIVMLAFIGITAFAYDFPVLQKTLGGMDKENGVVISKSCQIFDDQKEMKLDELFDLIRKAEKEPMQKFVHVVKQVPSIQVWANYPVRAAGGPAVTILRPQRVLLLEDSSSGQSRNGKSAGALMRLVEKLCKDLRD